MELKKLKLKDIPPVIVTGIVVLIVILTVNTVNRISIKKEINSMKLEIISEIQHQPIQSSELIFPTEQE